MPRPISGSQLSEFRTFSIERDMLSMFGSKKIWIVIVVTLIGAGVLGERLLFSHPVSQSKNPDLPYFDYLVVIVMENAGINATYGSSCKGNCTYVTQLANTFSLAKNYSGVAHRSGPDYLTLTSGGNYSYSPFDTDCGPQVGDCYITAPNIIDRIEATGRTWKAYMEDYPLIQGCSRTQAIIGKNAYVNDHNPFLYYTDISNDPSRCSRIVSANPQSEGYLALPTVLFSDLNNLGSTPNFMWLSPNGCDDGHSTCTDTYSNSTCTNFERCISQGNEYLSLVVPQILASNTFKTRNAILYITWDEGNSCTNPPIGQTYPTCIDRVPAIFAGSHVKRGYVSNTGFSHYSFVKTLEVAWNFSALTPLDDGATPMTTFFDPPLASSEAALRSATAEWTIVNWICKHI